MRLKLPCCHHLETCIHSIKEKSLKNEPVESEELSSSEKCGTWSELIGDAPTSIGDVDVPLQTETRAKSYLNQMKKRPSAEGASDTDRYSTQHMQRIVSKSKPENGVLVCVLMLMLGLKKVLPNATLAVDWENALAGV